MDGSSSGSFTAMPDDIIMEILSRLPMKSLYRFKSVSKKWQGWITSDLWFKKLTDHNSLRHPRLISYEIKGFNKVILMTTDLGCGRIVDEFHVNVASGSVKPFIQVTFCKGLICIFSDIETVVCNPSNRGLIKFGNCRPNLPNCVGIGYVASSNVYKVVSLFPAHGYNLPRIAYKIFTIKENYDDELEVFASVVNEFSSEPFKFYPLDDRLPICVNGIMYWIMKNSTNLRLSNLAYYLDLDKHHFGTVPCPKLAIEDKILASYENMKFVELHGWLCLECFRSSRSSNIVFYALKDVQNGIWEMFYKILIPLPGIPHVLGVKPGDIYGDEEIVIAFNKSGLQLQNKRGLQTIYLYNSRDQCMKKVKIISSYQQPRGRFKFLHFGSIFSLKNKCYAFRV